jgi:hypothetical protein
MLPPSALTVNDALCAICEVRVAAAGTENPLFAETRPAGA